MIPTRASREDDERRQGLGIGLVRRSEVAFAHERQNEIERLVELHGRVRVSELAERFGVSGVTVRKDLEVLAQAQRVKRTYGGAVALTRSDRELSFDARAHLEQEAKDSIGALAAGLVRDGESIVLDASTTALVMARHLLRKGNWHSLTVVTNGIRTAEELAVRDGITVLMMGGRIRWQTSSMVGPLGTDVLKRVNVQKAFLGAVGLTLAEGLTQSSEEEAQIRRPMVAAAHEVYAIVDRTKWGRVASATFCKADRLTQVVTDDRAPQDMVDALEGAGIPVLRGPASPA